MENKRIFLYIILGLFSMYISVGTILTQELELKFEKVPQIGQKVVYEKITFSSKELRDIYIEDKKLKKIFGWYTDNLSPSINLILSSMFLSCLGSIIFIIWRKPQLVCEDETKYIIGGFFSGFIIWLILYLTPLVFYKNETEINFKSLFTASFLVGLFQEKFLNWLTKIFDKVFNQS